MKVAIKSITLFIFVLILILSFFTKTITMSFIPKIKTIYPVSRSYTPYVEASGVIEDQNKYEVYLDAPIIPSNLKVSIGDKVEKGDLLFEVDKKATIQSMSKQNISAIQIPDEFKNFVSDDLIAEVINSNQKAIEQSIDIDMSSIPDTVHSPLNGIITDVNIKNRSISNMASSLITISNTENLVAKISIREADIPNVAVGQMAILSGIGFQSKSYTGIITKIYPATRSKVTGMLEETVLDVIVKIDNPDDGLKIGLNTNAKIILGERESKILLPYEAIHQDDKNQQYVFVNEGNKVKKVFVTTGAEFDECSEIKTGITLNDRVIITNATLNDGDYISF